MDFILQQSLKAIESGMVPDQVIRGAIRTLCKKRLIEEGRDDPEWAAERYTQVLNNLKQSAIALDTDKANEQHYELPTAFFQAVLGKHLKYSACYFPSEDASLNQAEDISLNLYAQRAELKDGQNVLELGCGWGSLSLWMAEHYPTAEITAMSNSATQRYYIETQARKRQLKNLKVFTCDINNLELPDQQFDRVVSVEMFEHVRNYQRLFAKINRWLKPDELL